MTGRQLLYNMFRGDLSLYTLHVSTQALKGNQNDDVALAKSDERAQ